MAAVRLLGQHGLLSHEVAAAVRKAVGFRDVLVHEYVKVRDEVAVGRLADLSDLESFVREVAAFMGREA